MASSDKEAVAPATTCTVVFAYDGSELAGSAIEQAAGQLASGRNALVLCVWQPVDVGFIPIRERHFDADQATEVRSAAEETAAYGARLAEAAGEFEELDSAVPGPVLEDDVLRPIRRRIQGKNDLIVLSDGRQHRPDRAEELGDGLFLLINRNDKA